MRERTAHKLRLFPVALILSAALFAPCAARAQSSNAEKARALVNAAIKMTDTNEAVKLLWQATNIDPALPEAYVYLGLYYNSRSDYANMVKVYQRQIKNQPGEISGYLNAGEAYMSFTPPRTDEALAYFRRAYAIDPKNPFAALRIGMILAHEGSREEAVKYLRIAMAAGSKSPSVSAEAEKELRDLGAM
jgi:tetratricopeptide (TPR) repeat protein